LGKVVLLFKLGLVRDFFRGLLRKYHGFVEGGGGAEILERLFGNDALDEYGAADHQKDGAVNQNGWSPSPEGKQVPFGLVWGDGGSRGVIFIGEPVVETIQHVLSIS